MLQPPSAQEISGMDKRIASIRFNALVQDYMESTGADHIKAWGMMRDGNPELFAKMTVAAPEMAPVEPAGWFTSGHEAIPGLATPPNSYTSNGTLLADNLSAGTEFLRGQRPSLNLQRGKVAIPNAGNIEALGLPVDASYDEFRCADRANAGASPRNSVLIFQSLKGLFAGATDEDREAKARERFPQLASENDVALSASAKAATDAIKARLASGGTAESKPAESALANSATLPEGALFISQTGSFDTVKVPRFYKA